MIERCRAIVADAKRRWKAVDADLRCRICHMSFAEVYGARGVDFIEAHHRVPLASLTAGTETHTDDLLPVCANCHRMLHRGAGCSVGELAAVFANRGHHLRNIGS
jgi:predicted HNH restriction endonuclease